MRGTSAWIAVLLACGWTMATVASAELLRCTGPDGKTIYTDNKALCPEAKPFEPTGELQSGKPTSGPDAQESEPAPASRRDALAERLRRAQERQAAFEAEEGEAKRWKEKKGQLEAEIQKLGARREYLERFITNCNRGGLVFARDDAGIKRTIKCQDIKAQYASVGEAKEKAEAKLARLPEECRKAGCLPGWLR